jgi:DNA-binding SARP family transcriptional activator
VVTPSARLFWERRGAVGKLELMLLGPPEAQLDGRALTFRTRKTLALLVYLAVERGPHLREDLAELLWPQSGRSKGRIALRSALADLRRVLRETETSRGKHLLVERDSLSFDSTSDAEIDLETIHAAFKAARIPSSGSGLPQESVRRELLALLGEAANAYQGEFLQGFYLDDAPEFDYWANLERERWRTEVGLVFDRLSQGLLEAGEVREAVDVAERWVDHDPLSEDANERLMRTRYSLGDRAGALLVYEHYRSTLKQNLVAKPGSEADALAARIEAENRRTASSRPSARYATMLPEPPFVGRAKEFGILAREYHLARSEGLRITTALGEAGMGKTRLANEFISWAEAQGADILCGRASRSGGLPYGPLVEAIRPSLERERAPDDLLEDVWLSELGRLLPEIRERYPDLPPPTPDETTAKARLYEAVCRLIVALSERATMVYFVDDLHWADAATLDILSYAAKHLTEHRAPVLLVLAAREEELDANDIPGWLSSVERTTPVERLDLAPLSGEDTLQLVRLLTEADYQELGAPTEVMEDFGSRLHSETRGQPFFIVETLKVLFERRVLVPNPGARRSDTVVITPAVRDRGALIDLLPLPVRELVHERLSRLSSAAFDLLAAGAVLGGRFDFDPLRQVAGVGESEGLSALDEVLRRRLLREDASGYALTHDKIRDVIYTEAGEARRRIFHRRALMVLEEEGASAAQLAHHALAAKMPADAFRYLLTAGDATMAVFAGEDAIGYYDRARGLLDGKPSERGGLLVSPATADLEHLYVNLGRAHELAGEWERAQTTYEEMLSLAREANDSRLQWAALNHLAVAAAQGYFDMERATNLVRESLEVAEASDDQAMLAETEWNLAQMATIEWKLEAALLHGERALELACQTNLDELEGRSLYVLGLAHILAGRFEDGVAHTSRSASLYEAIRDEPTDAETLAPQFIWAGTPPSKSLANRGMEALSLTNLAAGEINRGRPSTGVEASRRAVGIARELGNSSVQSVAMSILHYGLLEAGEYEEALRVGRQGLEAARKQQYPTQIFVQFDTRGRTFQAMLDLENAHAAFLEALAVAEATPVGPWRIRVVSGLCANRALDGDWETARRYAVEAAAMREAAPTRLMPLDFARHYETEALLRGGEERLAHEDVRILGERVGQNRRFRLIHLRMLAVVSRWNGERDEAITYLREAQILAEQIGLPGELWQIQSDLGELHKASRQPDAAQVAFNRAADTLRTLIENMSDEGLREGFLDAPLVRRVLEGSKGVVRRPRRASP